MFFFINLTSVFAKDQNQFGFVGDRKQTFVAGSPESVAIWKQWCALHEKGDVEGITALLIQWFDDNEHVRVFQRGVSLKFINEEGNTIDGDW